MRYLILLSFALLLAGCDRDQDQEIVGIVVERKGCYPDSYLISIVPGQAINSNFICPSARPPSFYTFDCTNAVYVHLPPTLAIRGKKIRFVYVGNEISCLSASEAPNHISVKSLRAD